MQKLVWVIAAAAIGMTASLPASAQQVARQGMSGDWGLFAYQGEKGKVCYTLSVPTKMEPETLDHGKKMYFIVGQRPDQNVAYEPQFMASYKFADQSKVQVTIGDKTFSMFTQGSAAFLENAAEEAQLMSAMRAGATMTVAARSSKNNPTKYAFSLKGISAALKSISECK